MRSKPLNPTLEPRKQEDTKRTGEHPQMTQITQMSRGQEPNLRNLCNLWMSGAVSRRFRAFVAINLGIGELRILKSNGR